MSAILPLNLATVLRNYFHAKDENRPHLMVSVFTPDAILRFVNHTSTISFPELTVGREGIAEVLSRGFGRTFENVYSFYMEKPKQATGNFSCDWLVAMSEKDNKNVRVGCGRYDWEIESVAPHLAAGLVITIEAMQVLPPGELEPTFEWVQRLSYPWSSAAEVLESAPRGELLAPVLRYLGRHASGA